MRLQAHEIRAMKGRRQLLELNVADPLQAAAAQAAGIDIIVSGKAAIRSALRQAAPDTHFCVGLVHGHHVTPDEALRAAFDALEAGADSIYTCAPFQTVEALSREGIPVVGHVGLVPQKARMTGYRAFGKTVEEAKDLFRTVLRYEDAGAFAIELEVVAAAVATTISRNTPLTVISMGSGDGCDVQYLFAIDVLGQTPGRMPRHARAYDDFAAEDARLQDRRIAAFAAWKADVDSGAFPAASETVGLAGTVREDFDMWIARLRKE
jgi:3-methyl-2-oxobutanoate hydroxymethyltransferase